MAEFFVRSRRSKLAPSDRQYVCDVTSRGAEPWCRFSPFYPHGDIPIPCSSGAVAASVEGVWQGLKVFEREGVDHESFENRRMRGVKRRANSVRGRILGHQKGLDSSELLDYREARRQIYAPTYYWVLENKLRYECEELKLLSSRGPVILLDFNTSADLSDMSRPLSHAALLIRYLTDTET